MANLKALKEVENDLTERGLQEFIPLVQHIKALCAGHEPYNSLDECVENIMTKWNKITK